MRRGKCNPLGVEIGKGSLLCKPREGDAMAACSITSRYRQGAHKAQCRRGWARNTCRSQMGQEVRHKMEVRRGGARHARRVRNLRLLQILLPEHDANAPRLVVGRGCGTGSNLSPNLQKLEDIVPTHVTLAAIARGLQIFVPCVKRILTALRLRKEQPVDCFVWEPLAGRQFQEFFFNLRNPPPARARDLTQQRSRTRGG